MKTLLALLVCLIATAASAQESVQQTLERLRPAYPNTDAAAAVYLNEVAWVHRTEGFALLGKEGGRSCLTPGNRHVSCDFLVHVPTKRGFDVIRGDDAGTPQFGGEGEDLTAALADGSRTVVLPVPPAGGPVDPPQPPAGTPGPAGPVGPTGLQGPKGDPGVGADLSPLLARLAMLEARTGVLESRTIPMSCTVRAFGIGISCKLQ